MFFTFPEDARWNADRRVQRRPWRVPGIVRVPAAFRRHRRSPTPERCMESYTSSGQVRDIVERKLRKRQLTDDGNVEITGRDLRGVCQETSLHRAACSRWRPTRNGSSRRPSGVSGCAFGLLFRPAASANASIRCSVGSTKTAVRTAGRSRRAASAALSTTRWPSILSTLHWRVRFVARWCVGGKVEIADGAFRVRDDAPASRAASPLHRTP